MVARTALVVKMCVVHPDREAWGMTSRGPLCSDCLDEPMTEYDDGPVVRDPSPWAGTGDRDDFIVATDYEVPRPRTDRQRREEDYGSMVAVAVPMIAAFFFIVGLGTGAVLWA